MAVLYSQDNRIKLEIKPIEIRNHLCGCFVNYSVLICFNDGTAIAMPTLLDNGSLRQFFPERIETKAEKAGNFRISYNNFSYNYLNEPLYSIAIDCAVEGKKICQLTLFDIDKPQPSQNIDVTVSVVNNFKESCCWDDFMEYVLEVQSLAKLVNTKSGTKLQIGIENGSLEELLLGNEKLGHEMSVRSDLKLTVAIDDYYAFQKELKSDLAHIKPIESTFIKSEVTGQNIFDMGPEAKPFVDTRRLKRLERLNSILGNIFAKSSDIRKSELLRISAGVEYMISEDLRNDLINIFGKCDGIIACQKLVQNASPELSEEIGEQESIIGLIDSILHSAFVSKPIVAAILGASCPKDIISIFDKIKDETSLKRLLKYIASLNR